MTRIGHISIIEGGAILNGGGWPYPNERRFKNPIERRARFMDVGIFVGIIALCLTCFMAGVQYGKDHGHNNDRPA